jgi:ANTAR domain/GAF domain
VCAVAATVVGVAGAGVILGDGRLRAPLCASDPVAARVDDLHFTLGEGPAVDAHRTGVPAAEPDTAGPLRARWPSFGPLAVDTGAAALFSFPLRVGGVRLGAMTLYRGRPGRLTDDQHADALAMADIVVGAVLAHQAGADPGDLASELEALSSSRAEVHQASGVVSVQLGVSVADALLRLRAHAYAEGRALSDVARDVVAGRLRLSE